MYQKKFQLDLEKITVVKWIKIAVGVTGRRLESLEVVILPVSKSFKAKNWLPVRGGPAIMAEKEGWVAVQQRQSGTVNIMSKPFFNATNSV